MGISVFIITFPTQPKDNMLQYFNTHTHTHILYEQGMDAVTQIHCLHKLMQVFTKRAKLFFMFQTGHV
jgi:hypothetical protein